MTSPASIAHEKYVSLVTRKKSGETVATAVWIAPLPDGTLGFTTDITSGKVKRIRNFADVTLQPCTGRGALKDGTTPVSAMATVMSGADTASIEAAIATKYGFIVKVIRVGSTLGRIVTRKPKSVAAAIRLELV